MGGFMLFRLKSGCFGRQLCHTPLLKVSRDFLNTLKEIDDFNSKKPKSVNKVVYEGYGVRNVLSSGGSFWNLGFFTTYPKKTKHTSSGGIEWVDSCGHALPLININLPKLFGKEGLEPMKLRITIEQIEE